MRAGQAGTLQPHGLMKYMALGFLLLFPVTAIRLLSCKMASQTQIHVANTACPEALQCSWWSTELCLHGSLCYTDRRKRNSKEIGQEEKNSSGQASNKRNVKFLNWLGDQHNTQEKRSFSSQFLVQLLTSSLHLSLLPFIYLFYFFRPKMSLRTTLPCICVVETNSLLIAERFRSTMMRATRASKTSLLPPAPLFIQKEIKGLISSRRAVTPADKSSLQT